MKYMRRVLMWTGLVAILGGIFLAGKRLAPEIYIGSMPTSSPVVVDLTPLERRLEDLANRSQPSFLPADPAPSSTEVQIEHEPEVRFSDQEADRRLAESLRRQQQ